MSSREHWESIYSTRPASSLSWFQQHALSSLRLLRSAAPDRSAAIIDVGGGASTLVDDLLSDGYRNVHVLDVSAAALREARTRLGERAPLVTWIEADITEARLPHAAFDVWHDRAVFHFLTLPASRVAYVRAVASAVKPGGTVIVATFADDGPAKCSGLPVVRYRPDELHAEFGAAFTLLHHEKEEHATPFGTTQQFVYCLCRRESAADAAT